MGYKDLQPKDNPCGSTLVRVADESDIAARLAAYAQLLRNGDITEEEAQQLLPVVLEPGDLTVRIAA